MTEIYIVIKGGCCQYVSSTSKNVKVHLIDLDDKDDLDHPEDIAEAEYLLSTAEKLPRIW